MPFDLMQHDALIDTQVSDADIDAIVDHCIAPLYVTLSNADESTDGTHWASEIFNVSWSTGCPWGLTQATYS